MVRRPVHDWARDGLDAALALLIFAACAGYLAAFPLFLGHVDEAHYLHEAKRVLAGERLYRDIFELATPGWVYLMAGLFRLFGATLSTARLAAAVIHAGTATVLFLVCRRLGVRRGLAVACAATYLFLCPPMFPVASQHWLVTLLGVVLLWLCQRPLAISTCVLLGLVDGLAIAMHQTRGLAMGVGVACFLVADTFLRRSNRQPAPSARLLALAAGVLIVMVPLLGFVVATSGLEPVWQALVVYPTQGYTVGLTGRWGWSGSPTLSLKGLLKFLPLALLCAVPRAAGWWRPEADRDDVRAGVLLIVLGAAFIASIWYFADYIHIAFIAPLFLVAMADGVERALRALPAHTQMGLGWVVTVAILAPLGVVLSNTLADERADRKNTWSYLSAFGPVEIFPSQFDPLDKLSVLLSRTPSRTLYCHPHSGYTYLLLGARNPTRFEFIRPGLPNAAANLPDGSRHSPAQVNEVIDVLRTREVPYVQMHPQYMKAIDPIAAFIREHYELVPDDTLRQWGVWRRRPTRPPATMDSPTARE